MHMSKQHILAPQHAAYTAVETTFKDPESAGKVHLSPPGSLSDEVFSGCRAMWVKALRGGDLSLAGSEPASDIGPCGSDCLLHRQKTCDSSDMCTFLAETVSLYAGFQGGALRLRLPSACNLDDICVQNHTHEPSHCSGSSQAGKVCHAHATLTGSCHGSQRSQAAEPADL